MGSVHSMKSIKSSANGHDYKCNINDRKMEKCCDYKDNTATQHSPSSKLSANDN